MSTDNLFPDEPKPKRKKKLQQQLLDYLRTGEIITEAIYRKEIGGKSVSAAIHNLKIRGHFEEGEFIVNEKVKDSEGNQVHGYRLAKETRHVDFSQKELDEGFVEESEIEGNDFSESFKEDAEDIVLNNAPPEVSSIVVGVKGDQPELIIMFMGDEYKPLRHVMTQTEVRYLITNLMAFIPLPQE